MSTGRLFHKTFPKKALETMFVYCKKSCMKVSEKSSGAELDLKKILLFNCIYSPQSIVQINWHSLYTLLQILFFRQNVQYRKIDVHVQRNSSKISCRLLTKMFITDGFMGRIGAVCFICVFCKVNLTAK